MDHVKRKKEENFLKMRFCAAHQENDPHFPSAPYSHPSEPIPRCQPTRKPRNAPPSALALLLAYGSSTQSGICVLV
jgi:hypothetical protein